MAKPKHYAVGQSPRFRSVLCAAIVGVTACATILCAWGCDAAKKSTEPYEEQYLPGQPLDAVRLSAPTFAEGEWCYKVADRTSGACWWLVKVDGEWQVLMVCEGHSYVRQQQEEAVK